MTKVMGPVFVGIDVSACTLVVALERDHRPRAFSYTGNCDYPVPVFSR